MGTPYIGGSKKREAAILKWNGMSPLERYKYLQLPSVDKARSMVGKYNKAIDEIMKKI